MYDYIYIYNYIYMYIRICIYVYVYMYKFRYIPLYPMTFHYIGGFLKWGYPKMVFMEKPIKMDDLAVRTPISGNLHIHPYPTTSNHIPIISLSYLHIYRTQNYCGSLHCWTPVSAPRFCVHLIGSWEAFLRRICPNKTWGEHERHHQSGCSHNFPQL